MAAKEKTELWWGLYQEHTVQGRHHETLRSSAAALVLTFAGAIIALGGLDRGLGHDDWIWGLALCLLGLFGGLFSLKHYERFEFHTSKARAYRNALDGAVQGADLASVNEKGRTSHESSITYRLIGRLRLHDLWSMLYVLVGLAGMLLMVLALMQS